MVGAHEVAAFRLRDVVSVPFERVWEDMARTFLVKPCKFALTAQKDATEHEVLHTLRMVLGVDEGERRAPRAAEHHPFVDAQVFAELLNVGHGRHGRVVFKFSPWRRAATATLIELDDAPMVRIEVTAVIGLAAPAWAAVDDEHRRPFRMAGNFPCHAVHVTDVQHAFEMRFNAGIEHTVKVGHASATRPEFDGVLHHQDDAMQPEARRMTDVRPAVDVFSDWATEGRDEGMERGHAAAVGEMLAFGLNRTATLGHGFRAIDVGCGNGWVVRQLAAVPFCSHAEGVDGAPGMIEKAKRVDPEGHYHHAMLPDWTPEGRFDLLISMEVLYYLHDPAAMLAAFRNAWLEPGGWAVVGVDHYAEHEDSLDWPEKVGVHMTTMSEAQWLQAWAEAGFESIETWRAAGDPGTLVIAGRCPS